MLSPGEKVNRAVRLSAEEDARLIANGYEPIAVDGKSPRIPGWQTSDITVERLAAMREAYPEKALHIVMKAKVGAAASPSHWVRPEATRPPPVQVSTS
jgi:hypothetical protein